jgi:hypothetical protein
MMKSLRLLIIVLLLLPLQEGLAQFPSELKLETVSASSSKWEVKAIMIPGVTIVNVEAVSVAVSYDPSVLGLDPTNPITNKYFQAANFDDGSIPDWDVNGVNPDVTLYSEYHPNFGSAPILKNAPPTLCHFVFIPKSGHPPTATLGIWQNTPTGALTYYFESGVAQQQNFSPATGLTDWIPVELTSFTAAQQGEGVALRWVTASETNNYGFHIERRDIDNATALEWETIGFMAGAGNSRGELQYLMIDTDLPHDGVYMYRLRQQDFDGTTSYSPEVLVEYTLQPHAFGLKQNYPNPLSLNSGSGTTLQYNVAEDSHIRLSVRNMLGQEVATLVDAPMAAGSYSATWYPAGIPAGNYIATMVAETAQSGRAEVRHLQMQIVR